MRTAELIGLLRSQDRNKPVVSDHLAQLDNTRQLHLLGELSNWLLVELHKYQDRQTGLNDLETLQQGSIHSQIRHTLKAILTIIQSITISTTNANSGNSEYAASVTPVSTKHSQKQKTVLPLDDRDKERILDGFLRPVLIGVVPLGPRVDSTDVQLLCAKILCICTSPLTVNPPFPPQEFTKYMFSISASYSTLHSKTRGDNQANGTSIAHAQRGNDADVILALSSLLGSTSIKLQEYGLRILTSHKFITKEKFAWEILPSLRSVLEDFKNDLVAIQTSSMSIFETNHTSANPNSESTVKDENSARKHNSQSGDSSSIGIRSKALLILQSFQQEAGRSLTPLSVASTQQPIDRHVKPAQLDEAAPMSLLIDLWKNIQEIFFFDKAALPSCDRIILALCGTIYWSCWFSQEWGFGMVMLIEQGMETLLAWYGYYITSHDDGDHNGENNVDSSLSIATAQTLAQKKESNSTILEKEDDMRHQACVLEYLTKLIGILVSNKSNNKALYSGYPRPVGLTIVRRTIEFFNDLTTTSNRTSTAGASSIPAILSSPSPANTSTTNSVAQVSTAVQLIKIKPGILEAMLGIINSCFGSKKALDDLIIFSRVPNVLVMLLSESNSNELFRTPTKEFPEAMSRRFMSLALAILPGFLKRGSQNTWTEDVTWNEWTVGPGAIWMLSRIMVERSLVGTSFRNNRQNKPHSAGDNESDTSSLPHELVEKSLFDTLSKVMGSLESARAVVSNNTITELFAAILDIDHPLRFYCNKMHFELMEISDTTESVTNESDHHDKTMAPIENATGDSNLTAINTPLNLSNTTTPLNNGHIGSSPTTLLRAIDLILPTKRQQQLHCQLLHHFYQIMHPLQSQFERIYQYVGGRQGLAESNESSDSVFWMREYCALVFMYILTPPSSGTIMAPYFAWESKLDKTALLESESVLGVVCRMLTLEMVYDNEDEVESEFDITPAVGQDKAQDSKSNEENMNGVQREEALLRKFSSGLAFQSHGWRHVDRWRQQHLELVGTYSELMTMEWEAHVAKLSGAPLAGFTDAGTKEVTENLKRKNKAGDETAIPVVFSVQGRSLTFPDRECLSRVSPFFYTLLKGEFQESHQDTIVLHDVEPDNIELLLEILKESQVTSQHLLPKDLPLELVVQLMVCADRYLVSFVRRLAENWVLETLGELEMKEYDLCPTLQSDTIASNSRIESGATIALDGAKRMRSEDGLTRVRGNINGTTIDEKRPRLDPSKDIDLVDQSNRAAMEVVMSDDYDGHTETTPSSSSAFSFSSFTTSKEAATFEHGVSTATASKIIVDDNVIHSHDDQASLSGQQSPTNTEDNRDEEEQETLTIQDCLLIVYEACADPQFGSIYTTTHPFHGLVWDVLRRMMLRLGSVAIRPRFTTMLNRFGGERIQEFLQILYELAFDDSDSYLTSMTVE
ncbi:hypothetical protein FBU30_008578 [Linnemannia zychae]|nr:hypothetical protein FBU30_008578 [Linnemannia zychae]